ncbi:MAG TPA: heparinase II/III-family protein, partial [Gemmatimonadaceae bacterium]|nr:heparinase II/III-family protein [Gemmatimonadaceae bacterium]
VQRLGEVLLFLQRPDGTIPLFGDDDGGRLVQLDDRWPRDVRALLATAGAILGRGDFVWAGRGELASVLWLAGPAGLERLDALPAHPPRQRSRAFPDGGFYVLRDGWGADADWLAADAGPHGVMNCGHAHADALAFELVVGGRPVLMDAGTYVYHQPARNEFRAASAHNAIIIDGVPSSEPTSAFQWAHIAHGVGERALTEGPVELWEGAHDGYGRLPDPVAVRRGVMAVQGDYWLLRDRVTASGEHRLHWRFQLAPGLGTCMDHDGVTVIDAHGDEVIRLAAPISGLSWQVTDGWVSPTYGHRDRAPVITAARQGLGAHDVVIWMLPRRAPWRGARPVALPCEGGCAFVLRGEGVEDLVLLGGGGALRAGGVETDAEWLWLRRRPDGSGECVSIGATRLHVGGRRVFEERERAPYRMDELPGGAGVPAAAS